MSEVSREPPQPRPCLHTCLPVFPVLLCPLSGPARASRVGGVLFCVLTGFGNVARYAHGQESRGGPPAVLLQLPTVMALTRVAVPAFLRNSCM